MLAERACGAISKHDIASVVEVEGLQMGLEQHLWCHWEVGDWDEGGTKGLLIVLVRQLDKNCHCCDNSTTIW